MWPFKVQPAPVQPPPPPAPCGNQEVHDSWQGGMLPCPICTRQLRQKRAREEEDRLAKKIATNVVAMQSANKVRKWHLTYRDHPTNGQRVIDVLYTNGVHMGEIFQTEDGYFQWWPNHPGNGGFIEGWILREIADRLDYLNQPWDDVVRSELEATT